MNLKSKLERGETLLADGGTGTMLQNLGLDVGDAPERWTLERPDAIREVARLYAEAGSQLIYTNTFGANCIRAQRFDLAEKISELNRRAVTLAREGVAAADSRAFVIGSIGPTGEMLEPYGELTRTAAHEAFLEQVRALEAAGVDGIVCESFSDLNEALICIRAVRSVTSLPLFTSMSFEGCGRTMMGIMPEDAATEFINAGANAIGANCSVGVDAVENAVRAMKAAQPKARLIAKPNAGLPQVVKGKVTYAFDAASMATFAMRMKSFGVSIIGGCCGTTPEHIRAMKVVLDAAAPARKQFALAAK